MHAIARALALLSTPRRRDESIPSSVNAKNGRSRAKIRETGRMESNSRAQRGLHPLRRKKK